MHADRLIHGIDVLLTMDPNLGEGPLGRISDGAVAFLGSRIVFVGRSQDAPTATESLCGEGMLGMPGLVDCHTHAVWAGDRSGEFERRLAGETYTAILESGGGILSTVRATRLAEEDELRRATQQRLRRALAQGVTTMEIKSGYGLTPSDELKLLRVAKAAGDIGIRVLTTFLGAHTIPAEFRASRDEYVRQIVEEQLPVVAPFADFIDAYVDRGAFTLDEGQRILAAGRAAGLIPRVHAEQVTFTGAAKMAAELGATSADHLERIDVGGIEAMRRNGTVAVLLPGAMLYLKDEAPPVAKLRAAGVPMAVATDLNPGSSPIRDLWTCATLACVTMGLTVSEALFGVTRGGALALGRNDLGILNVGNPADFALFPVLSRSAPEAAMIHQMGPHPAHAVFCEGRRIEPMPAL